MTLEWFHQLLEHLPNEGHIGNSFMTMHLADFDHWWSIIFEGGKNYLAPVMQIKLRLPHNPMSWCLSLPFHLMTGWLYSDTLQWIPREIWHQLQRRCWHYCSLQSTAKVSHQNFHWKIWSFTRWCEWAWRSVSWQCRDIYGWWISRKRNGHYYFLLREIIKLVCSRPRYRDGFYERLAEAQCRAHSSEVWAMGRRRCL